MAANIMSGLALAALLVSPVWPQQAIWSSLSLNTETLNRCFSASPNNSLSYIAFHARISYRRDLPKNTLLFDNVGKNEYLTCNIRLTAPELKVYRIYVYTEAFFCPLLWGLHVYDGGPNGTRLIEDYCPSLTQKARFSSGQEVYIPLSVPNSGRPFYFSIMIDVEWEWSRRLLVQYTTNNTGYVQTPSWEYSRPYGESMSSCVTLTAPRHHWVMVSFAGLWINTLDAFDGCGADHLELFDGSACSGNAVLKLCGAKPPKPNIYRSQAVSLRFVTDHRHDGRGFKLHFMFVANVTLPQQLEGDKWNCSSHYGDELRRIFACDLKSDCAFGEDERNCSFEKDCGLGFISISGSCFKLLWPESKLTWQDASDMCLRLGLQLASLTSSGEWDDVIFFFKDYALDQVFVGLQQAASYLPDIYLESRSWQWADSHFCDYENVRFDGDVILPLCGRYNYEFTMLSVEEYNGVVTQKYLRTSSTNVLVLDNCLIPHEAQVLCEKHATPVVYNTSRITNLLSNPGPFRNVSREDGFIHCPANHVTHLYLACDESSTCWQRGSGDDAVCDAGLTPLPPSLKCQSGLQRVPYPLVCNHRSDCSDNSDEEFCVFPVCSSVHHFHCGTEQCIRSEQRCDGIRHCWNAVDEFGCNYYKIGTRSLQPPAVIRFSAMGTTYEPLLGTKCPHSHYMCLSTLYCLPVFTRCNDVFDCPNREDEAECDSYTCPGFYRCRASRICLHPDHLCDGVSQCPQRDDELLCHLPKCPDDCTCYGTAFFCTRPFNTSVYSELRFLDASGSGMSPSDLTNNTMLIYLSLASCSLSHLHNLNFPNLLTLDVSDNNLTTVIDKTLHQLRNLQVLSVAGNPVTSLVTPGVTFVMRKLTSLDISRMELAQLDPALFNVVPHINVLNLSATGLDRLPSVGFGSLRQLRVLDLRGCPISTFSRNVFDKLFHLMEVRADNFKLCCPASLPEGFNVNNCHAPSDIISSCDSLLRSEVFRIFLTVFAILGLTGNCGSFVYRVFIKRISSGMGFDVFVAHLSVADFLMGLYLAVVGTADRVYLGNYLWEDTSWRNSLMCRIAGFLSLLSNEVSAFIICLITLERLLVVSFPFGDFRFRKKSAQTVCAVAWLVGHVMAVVPLLPVTSHWEFYSQTAICTPLPFASKDFLGHNYSFAIMIVFNFALFLAIAVGQILIYRSIRNNEISASDTTRAAKDRTIARRLITIVVSNFLCWFPIGVLGLMASSGVPIPGEANVIVAIFVLPLNSALNPFLYTLNVVLEQRQKAKEARLQKLLLSQVKAGHAGHVMNEPHNHVTNEPRGHVMVEPRSHVMNGPHDHVTNEMLMTYTEDDVLKLLDEFLRDGELSLEDLQLCVGHTM